MKLRTTFLVAAFANSLVLGSTPAHAAPGLAEKVYGARVDAGVTELEARYGRLQGRADAGNDAFVLEAAHGFNDQFYGAILTEFERENGGDRRLTAFAVEGIYTLGHIKALAIDVALYGEYGAARGGPDKFETKLLLQHRQGAFDGRLNLVAERPLTGGSTPVAFEYAASADWQVADEVRLGGAAFGQLGDTRRLSFHGEHFVGPIAKYEIEHLGRGELGIETGYLFALGQARNDAHGQLRLLLEYETKF